MQRFVFILIFAAAAPCFSQGTVNFANGAVGVDEPLTNSTVSPAVRASGPEFQAQLYVGPAGVNNMFLLTTNGVSGTSAPFQTGLAAGYFFGGTRTIRSIAPGTTATLQVRVWAMSAGSSWETAGVNGRTESNLIQVSLGGATFPVPTPTPNMVGLRWAAIPEPSSIALAVMGAFTVLFFGMCRGRGRD